MATNKKIQTITDVVAALDKAQTMHKATPRQSVDVYLLLYRCKRFIEAHPELCDPPLRDRYTRLATRLQEEVFELDEEG